MDVSSISPSVSNTHWQRLTSDLFKEFFWHKFLFQIHNLLGFFFSVRKSNLFCINVGAKSCKLYSIVVLFYVFLVKGKTYLCRMVQLMCIKAKTFIAQRILGRNNFIYLPCKDTRQLNIIFWVRMMYLQFIVTTTINIQSLISSLGFTNINTSLHLRFIIWIYSWKL